MKSSEPKPIKIYCGNLCFTVFRGADYRWYWRANPRRGGRQLACGGEGFTKVGALRSLRRFLEGMGHSFQEFDLAEYVERELQLMTDPKTKAEQRALLAKVIHA